MWPTILAHLGLRGSQDVGCQCLNQDGQSTVMLHQNWIREVMEVEHPKSQWDFSEILLGIGFVTRDAVIFTGFFFLLSKILFNGVLSFQWVPRNELEVSPLLSEPPPLFFLVLYTAFYRIRRAFSFKGGPDRILGSWLPVPTLLSHTSYQCFKHGLHSELFAYSCSRWSKFFQTKCTSYLFQESPLLDDVILLCRNLFH